MTGSEDSLREIYVDEVNGFEIMGPKGWYKYLGSGGRQGEVKFIRESSAAFPILGVTTDSIGDFLTLLEYTNYIIEYLRENFANRQGVMKLLEPSHEIEINGIKGTKFVYEVTGPVNMKAVDYKFMKNNLIVSIQGVATPDTFDKYVKDFEEAIASFKFLDHTNISIIKEEFMSYLGKIRSLEFSSKYPRIIGRLSGKEISSSEAKDLIGEVEAYKKQLEEIMPPFDLKKYHEGFLCEIDLLAEALGAIIKNDQRLADTLTKKIEKSVKEGADELMRFNKLFFKER
jgi:hypothetical protein